MNFMKVSASLRKFFSYILHPLLMPTTGIFIIFSSNTTDAYMPDEYRKYVYLLIISGTFILPLCLIPFYKYRNIISGAEMKESHERRIPLLITAALFILTAYYLYTLPSGVLRTCRYFCTAGAAGVVFNYLINLRWKISSHMIGIGGITGLVVSLWLTHNQSPLIFAASSILASGILAWARCTEGPHSKMQIFSGYVLGIVLVILCSFISRLSGL